MSATNSIQRLRSGLTRDNVGGTSLATRLAAALVTVSVLSLLVAMLIGIETGQRLGREQYEDRLVAVRSSGVADVEAELTRLSRIGRTLATSPQAAASMEAFSDAFAQLPDTPPGDDEVDALLEEYQATYIDELEDVERDVDVRDVVPSNPEAVYLQFRYAVETGAAAEPETVDDARDGSEWSAVHSVVHPVYRDVVDRLELVDLYFVDADADDVVYSVRKRPDLGTNTTSGPFSGSVLAAAVEQVRADPTAPFVVTDFGFYTPSTTTPVGALAVAVRDDADRFVGTIVLMFDAIRFTDLLGSSSADVRDDPESAAGEAFIIGDDGLIRTDLRSFHSDQDAHLDAAEQAGTLDAEDRAAIAAAGSPVLLQPVSDATLNAALVGDAAIERRIGFDGADSFSTVTPVEFGELRWFVVAELDAAEAQDGLDQFQSVLIVGTSVFVVLLAFWAVWWAGGVVRPIRMISDRLGVNAETDEAFEMAPFDLPERSPVEFHRLAADFASMEQTLRSRRRDVEAERRLHESTLRLLLPGEMADRRIAGDPASIDLAPGVSIAVVRLIDTSTESDAAAGARDLEHVLALLDRAAEEHGLDRICVFGTNYVAGCGHDQPYIDHTPRAIAFLAEATELLASMETIGVQAAAGCAVGPVAIGLVGPGAHVFDVWGATVGAAHDLAARATPGEIRVSAMVAGRLPADVRATAVEAADGDIDAGRSDWSIDVHDIELAT